APAGEPRLTEKEIQVTAASYPYLSDHVIEGIPVLPVAMAVEWLVGAAQAGGPAAAPVVLRDLNVLRKVGLTDLAGAGHRLLVRVRDERGRNGAQQTVELVGAGGVTHYRALVGAPVATATDEGSWSAAHGLPAAARPVLYDRRTLFHGPRFQAIRSLDGLSRSGAAATLVGARALGWAGSGWHTDPALTDGALQVAAVWAEMVLGGAALPMAIDECRIFRPGLPDGTVRCELRPRSFGSALAECDVRIIDPDGSVRVELLGVTGVLRPARTQSTAP